MDSKHRTSAALPDVDFIASPHAAGTKKTMEAMEKTESMVSSGAGGAPEGRLRGPEGNQKGTGGGRRGPEEDRRAAG